MSKGKTLPSKDALEKKFGYSVPEFIRKNGEISKWLLDIFKWKSSGEVLIRFADIARELSEFSGENITGSHIARAYNKWEQTGKI